MNADNEQWVLQESSSHGCDQCRERAAVLVMFYTMDPEREIEPVPFFEKGDFLASVHQNDAYGHLIKTKKYVPTRS